ncbi:glycerol-3-phosphate acyltransferase PlsX [Levilactobacillus namurensis DSM 19117]|uniref:Phosphate acyltransferase n=2 Tax=Levilactobacillus namurensis TaxID=380393 RepID=A0A0R1KBM5_9LACO|nr:phosphate acyltransferase PlsX [Levilactobacillus namurensis]PTM23852.1 phosphate acyltransferase PlsX [Lactobacillus sp. PFC-70]KRK77162.1 glycerol-3-phosphate acyltransferase PlsX [Levilactobacillus namurensis DSM 19117]MCW3777576.1 phosphate acyltransferase PlsX [Levilactobacillus namurensis]MDT7014294.1 phosphate acyltransferase PlsX [Levilactobacillus namurensis]MDT7018776.1 phosphate acyltransferase PlsX [Levilactobacillus namurensis]
MKIAVDAMGGDYAPDEIVKGVELARDAYPDLEFLLYGQADKVQPLLQDTTRITLKPAEEVIAMGDEPVRAVRRKKHSSIVLAATAVKEGEADAFFSAGNTGAVLTAGLLIVGRIKGIDRPGLTTTLPVLRKPDQSSFVMLDVGANADTKPFNVVQYAIMGQYYAQSVMHVAHPRIGLLNNGTEADKGDKAHRAIHDTLAGMDDIHFVGNVESRELLNGAADVVVTDGFTGNATLKAIEGTALSMLKLIKGEIMSGGLGGKLGASMLRPVFHRVRDAMDYSQYGGAVLLGLKAPVVKTHGSTKAETVKNTMGQIHELLATDSSRQMINYFTDHAEQMAALKETLK